MCGIFGFNWEDRALLKNMGLVVMHRGPDDEGYFTDKNFSLGHKRLSIIDLSEKARNPIFNDKKNLCIIFNGEIYNFKEIREKLKKKNKLVSESDTEVILFAYEQYGKSFLNKLNGMFAFAIYDLDKRELFIARDRLGIKPLYYYHKDGKFIFASEIKAILQHKEVKREVDLEAMNSYFTYRFTPGTKTLFKNIYKLRPGHYLVFKNGKISINQYWDLTYKEGKESEEHYSKDLLEHLKKSIEYRLISDVPLGAYLSGGLDSSAIVALMSQLTDKVTTFNVSFDDERYDESRYARIVAEAFGTRHHEIDVRVDALKVLPEVVRHLDEPLSDASCIPTYLMARATKKHVTVVLSGEGSDELFAGYPKYKALMINKKLAFIPRELRRISLPVNKKLERFFNMAQASEHDQKSFVELISVYNEREKAELYQKPVRQQFNPRPFFNNRYAHLNKMLYFDIKTWLPDDLFLKNDKMTMAHSVEARVPFMDHNLVEYSGTIPAMLKMKRFKEKYIYRKAVQKILPRVILKRKKTGFTVPLKKWMGEGLKDYAHDVFKQSKHNLFNKQEMFKVLKTFDKSIFHKRQFYTLLMFELWHKQFIENEKIR